MFGIGPLELLLILGAAVLLFGGDLPDAASRAGQVLGRLRATADDLTKQMHKAGNEVTGSPPQPRALPPPPAAPAQGPEGPPPPA